MLDEIVAMPEHPEELRTFTARLLAEVKTQAILIEKLRQTCWPGTGRIGSAPDPKPPSSFSWRWRRARSQPRR